MIGTHILPNIVAPLVVFATFGVATGDRLRGQPQLPRPRRPAADAELGQPGPPDAGRHGARALPWQWVPPATFIVLMVLAVNFVGDGLRDAFDQRSTSDR